MDSLSRGHSAFRNPVRGGDRLEILLAEAVNVPSNPSLPDHGVGRGEAAAKRLNLHTRAGSSTSKGLEKLYVKRLTLSRRVVDDVKRRLEVVERRLNLLRRARPAVELRFAVVIPSNQFRHLAPALVKTVSLDARLHGLLGTLVAAKPSNELYAYRVTRGGLVGPAPLPPRPVRVGLVLAHIERERPEPIAALAASSVSLLPAFFGCIDAGTAQALTSKAIELGAPLAIAFITGTVDLEGDAETLLEALKAVMGIAGVA